MSVQRLDHLDESVLRQLAATGTPTLFKGLARNWPAVEKWNPDYLAAACGDRKYPVHYYPDGSIDAQPGGVKDMTLREFLDVIDGTPEAHKQYYLSDFPFDDMSEQLSKDVAFPPFMNDLPDVDDQCFVGRDALGQCHIHTEYQAVVFQLVGRKTFSIFHPRDIKHIYLKPFYHASYNHSRIDFRAISYERFPRARRLKRIDVELEPGDVFFIPVQWPHFTIAHGFNFTLTRWYEARYREFYFPGPGLHCLLGKLVENFAETWIGKRTLVPVLEKLDYKGK